VNYRKPGEYFLLAATLFLLIDIRCFPKDQTRQINNSALPKYGEIKLDLKEEIRIGSENDEDSLFNRVGEVAVDREDNIYINDMSNFRIQKFDRNGKYLQTIGRFGQGPGELQMPFFIRVENIAQNIFIRDYGPRIVVFTSKGNLLRQFITAGGSAEDFVPNADGSIWAIRWTHANNHELCKIDENGKDLRTLSSFPYTAIWTVTDKVDHIYTSGYELGMYIAEIDEQSIIYGYSGEYSLHVIDRNGQPLYDIVKDEPPPRFTADEKNRFKKSSIPSKKPYYFKIITDSEGRIYVQRNMNTKTILGRGPSEPIEKEVDIFSKNGIFLYKSKLPGNTCVIKDGFLYNYHIDEETGLEIVKRFRINNWSRIKTE
jgi:hypothetical protein